MMIESAPLQPSQYRPPATTPLPIADIRKAFVVPFISNPPLRIRMIKTALLEVE
jgi:hypothetical protein